MNKVDLAPHLPSSQSVIKAILNYGVAPFPEIAMQACMLLYSIACQPNVAEIRHL